MTRPFYTSTPVSLAGLVACLITQADWWTHSMGSLKHVPIVPKSYPAKRDGHAHRPSHVRISQQWDVLSMGGSF